MPVPTQRRGIPAIVWILLGAVSVLGALGVLNGIAKKKSAAEMLPLPAELPAPVPPDFAYLSSPPKTEGAVSKAKPAHADPSPATRHADPGSELTVAPYTNFKPEIAKNKSTPYAKSERQPPEVFPRMETGPVKKKPSADAAARILRQDANARAAARKQAATRNAQAAPSAANSAPAEKPAPTGASYLWVGRFQREDRAHEAEKKIAALGLPAAVVAKHGDSGDFYIVYSGPYLNDKIAGAMQQLKAKGFSNVRAVALSLVGKNANQ
jgi:cell division septation protein DedD